jgi:hypothetical protein
MAQATIRTVIVEVVHVTITCEQAFEAVRNALVKDVPPLDPQLTQLLMGANTAEIEERRAAGQNSGCSRLAIMGRSSPRRDM